MLTYNSSECNRKYRRARGDGRSLPLDIVSEPGIGSAISSTAISLLDSMIDGEIVAGVKNNKNTVEMRESMSINAGSGLGSRPGLRFKHISLIRASERSTSTIEDTLYSSFRQCIENCEKHHPIRMQPRSTYYLKPNYLLDCFTREVVRTEGSEKYACLSYTWQDMTSTDPQYSLFGQGEAPRTIEDAILVVRRLRLRYLWIDRYCINQGDVMQRSQDVENMLNIFQGASIILAAPGPHEHYGLPSLSTKWRISHHQLLSRKGTAASMSLEPGCRARNSMFQDRGVSRRVLFFDEKSSYLWSKSDAQPKENFDNQPNAYTDG